ncbi:MAG: hypothetical protein ACO2ZS_02075, partial [Burkholderiaceae bacterium]
MWGPRRGGVALVWPNGDTGSQWFACARGARNQGALRWASGLGVETMLAWVKNQRVRGVDVVLPTQQQHASVPMWQDAMQAQRQAQRMVSEALPLHYARASDLLRTLQQGR